MKEQNINRRAFLQSSMYTAVGLSSASLIASEAFAMREAREGFRILTSAQARLLETISARLIPTTDTPGAREAGVVYYYDIALADKMSDMRNLILDGSEEFAAKADVFYGMPFEELSDAQQDELLTGSEDEPFFGALLLLTQWGFFAMSKHGGNKDHLSWKLLNFEGHGGTKLYPFGYYDAQIHGGSVND